MTELVWTRHILHFDYFEKSCYSRFRMFPSEFTGRRSGRYLRYRRWYSLGVVYLKAMQVIIIFLWNTSANIYLRPSSSRHVGIVIKHIINKYFSEVIVNSNSCGYAYHWHVTSAFTEYIFDLTIRTQTVNGIFMCIYIVL